MMSNQKPDPIFPGDLAVHVSVGDCLIAAAPSEGDLIVVVTSGGIVHAKRDQLCAAADDEPQPADSAKDSQKTE